MPDRLDLYFRSHTTSQEPEEQRGKNRPPTEPEQALIFRCATTADEKRELLLGAYICAELKNTSYVAREIGLFSRDGHPEEVRILKRFVKGSAFELGTLDEFRRKVFLKYLKAGALIVAYDAPIEISRIAVKWNKSLKRRHAFSFYFRLFMDKKTGKVRPSGFEPGLSIESLDASKAIYRLIKYAFYGQDAEREEEEPLSDVHVLDLKTLTAVLTGETYIFSSACQTFGVAASRRRKPGRTVTKPAIECLLRDVTAALGLLNRLRQEFAPHDLDLALERCYSPATVSKTYYSKMGVKPPKEKFNIPDRINGIAMQAFAAGRAECTITRTLVPVTYLDFHAQYPAVSKLLDCREILCAESLNFADFTSEAREMVESITPDDCRRPEFWKQLRWYALVELQEDIVPLRAKFAKRDDGDPTLGWNFLTSKQPIWITGPDAIAAKLLTGKPLKILEAVAVIPSGVQPGLRPVKLCGQVEVDPRRDDLAVKLVELRSFLKKTNPTLAGGLKVAANSAVFGILCQVEVKDFDSPAPVCVFSGEADYQTPLKTVWEEPAEFYCPVIASLVTGGSHLLCAMLERAVVRDMGGHIAAMDADSAMIVSTKNGGLVPCAGGPHHLKDYQLPSGHTAIRALSFSQVDALREHFEPLNPWRDTLDVPFLRLEKENSASNGDRQQLYAYCISAKLYCLFNLDGQNLLIRKPSGHGLGFLQPPYSVAAWQRRTGRKWTEDLPPWIFEAWHLIISRELELPHKPPSWLKQPAVVVAPVNTPKALEQLGCFKHNTRPFTVMTVPLPRKETGLLWKGFFIMPYTDKLNDLHGRPMVNVVSGQTFFIHDANASKSPKPLGGLPSRRWKTRLLIPYREPRASFAPPTAAHARARHWACSCAGTSSQVSFITSEKRPLHAGRADPTCP
jgi:hypothetical protein